MHSTARIFLYLYPDNHPLSREERLIACVNDYLAAQGLAPFVELEIEKKPKGKPFLKNASDLHYSISHSGDYWVCAVAGQPLGVDIERHHPVPFQKIARRFFHPDEIVYLEKAGETGFFALWTAKESYVKYTGQGVGHHFSDFCVASPTGLLQETQGVQLRHIPVADTYSLCLCAAKIEEVGLIRC